MNPESIPITRSRFEILSQKRLIGLRKTMSLSVNTTGELWREFMPRRREIRNNIGQDLYAVQMYDAAYFDNFNPEKQFVKWASIEVTNFDNVPEGMETMTLPGGQYAVFIHRGPASAGRKTFQYIFETWLPGADYSLDHRPHFEILGARYKHEDPASEEEIWIPVKTRR